MFRDAGGYTDLVQQFGSELAYSFVFDGQLGNGPGARSTAQREAFAVTQARST